MVQGQGHLREGFLSKDHEPDAVEGAALHKVRHNPLGHRKPAQLPPTRPKVEGLH